MAFFKKSILALSVLSITSCSSSVTPTSPQDQEQKSFQIKGPVEDAIKQAAQKNVYAGMYNGRAYYKDNIGYYHLGMANSRIYLCKFNPAWWESMFYNVQKCK